MTSREVLWIYDRAPEEADGVVFNGYWGPDSPLPKLDVGEFSSIWSEGAVVCHSRAMPDDYFVASIVVKILRYPAAGDWIPALRSALRWFVERGAVVSWCGHELCSQSIEAFGPHCGDGLVYAAYSNRTGMLCRSGLDDEVQFLDDSDSLRLWQVIESARHKVSDPAQQ